MLTPGAKENIKGIILLISFFASIFAGCTLCAWCQDNQIYPPIMAIGMVLGFVLLGIGNELYKMDKSKQSDSKIY